MHLNIAEISSQNVGKTFCDCSILLLIIIINISADTSVSAHDYHEHKRTGTPEVFSHFLMLRKMALFLAMPWLSGLLGRSAGALHFCLRSLEPVVRSHSY